MKAVVLFNRHICLLLVFCGMVLLWPVQGVAGEEPLKITQTIRLYDGVLSYPPPLWMKSEKDLGDFKVSRKQEKNSFSFEQIPKKQEFASWTNIYGVYAWQLPDYTMERFIQESLNALSWGCEVQASSTIVSSKGGGVLMTFHCDEMVKDLTQNGNDVESGFLYMTHAGNTFAKVYQAWRANSKDKKTDRWPINEQVITDAVTAMESIRFIKAK